MSQRLAIDVGGTFTDVVLVNEETGQISFTKTPSSPGDPSDGVLKGIKKITAKVNIQPEEIDYFIHGTTFATNAFLEKKGSQVALLTTKGFRDIVEIGRQKRTKLYDLFQDKPLSIVERRYRYGVQERMGPKGEILVPLNEDQVIDVIKEIKEAGITSIAVVYLHSYANPLHELKTAEIINKWYPKCQVSLSHTISPEFREYERTITTVLNAYLKPNTNNYLINLSNKLSRQNVKKPYIMKSSGGAMTIDLAGDKVVETLLSGPAGGVIGSTFLAKKIGIQNIITLDMGGTSTDVAMILKQQPKTTLESLFKGYPLKVPMIEMETVGAGGGSIGWIDKGNLLKVGPQSAGAIPGPACYGNGWMEPTITDANLVLGRIDPKSFHNGEMHLDVQAAKQSLADIMHKTGMSLEEAALGIVEIANHHMAEAVRLVTIRKGYDPKEFALFAFGGASPLHASAIAKALNIPKVVIPRMSSEMSAFGFLAADIRHDFAITRLTPVEQSSLPVMVGIFKELKDRGDELLTQEQVPEKERLYLYRVDLRYKGQAFEITIDVKTSNTSKLDVSELTTNFHLEYERQYGQADKHEEIEIVNYRLSAIGITSKVQLEELSVGGSAPANAAKKGTRKVFLNSSREYEDLPVYEVTKLLASNQIEGPAIIDGIDTTILMETGDLAEMDYLGNLVITIKEESE
ncbi:hydantoinase/oxoprolinase family protein [Neobacillus mesonae]|uniref:hydantoinase/oxoprolinase family protein n=1 Tax=Neobacillus mesonae TaxID=1193713 RepID=UPI002E1E92B1|nr:hydantoinase/oxoprolinase family protein [Neobacillus mesonae]